MRARAGLFLILLVVGGGPICAAQAPGKRLSPLRITLAQGWSLQSSARVPDQGSAISQNGFSASGWYRTDVPSTVLAALVKNKVYRYPYFGMNLHNIPGDNYPIGANFSNLSMPAGT